MKKSKTIDFLKDLKEETISLLKQYGVKYNKTDSAHKLLVRYYTFMGKYIQPQERGVLVSSELTEKILSLPKKTVCAIRKLKQWTEQGININSFQSRSLYGSGGNKDFQNSLFGTVHLHLSARETDDLSEQAGSQHGRALVQSQSGEGSPVAHPTANENDSAGNR